MPRRTIAAIIVLLATASLAWAAPSHGPLFSFFRQLYLFSVVDSTGTSYRVSPRAAGIELGALEGLLLDDVAIKKWGDGVQITRPRAKAFSLGGNERLVVSKTSSFEMAGRAVHVSGRIDRMHFRDAEGFRWGSGEALIDVTSARLTAKDDGSTEAILYLSRSSVVRQLWRQYRAGKQDAILADWTRWQSRLFGWSPQARYRIAPGGSARAAAGIASSIPRS